MTENDVNSPNSSGKKGLNEKEIRKVIREEIESQTADHLSRELIKRLHFAIQKVEMYSVNHPMAVEAANQTFYFLTEFLNHQPNITLTLSQEGKMLVDNIAMPDDYFTRRFAKDFDKYSISSLTFHRDITSREMMSLVHFLEKRIGKKDKRKDIGEYLSEERVSHIEVNKIRYEIVHGDEDYEESQQYFRKEKLGTLLADYPQVFREVIGASGKKESRPSDKAEVVEELTETDIIDEVINQFRKRILKEDSSEQDRLINELIEELESSLSEIEKERLRAKLEKIKDEMILDSDSGTSKMIDDERKFTKLELFKEFEEYIHLIRTGEQPHELINRLESLFSRIFSEADNPDINHLYEVLGDAFAEDMNPNLLLTCPPFVNSLFDRCPETIINRFVEGRMREKREETEFDSKTPLNTEMLFFILMNIAKLDRMLSSLQLMKIYESRLKEENTPEQLKEDAEDFLSKVKKSSLINKFVEDIDDHNLEIQTELQEIFRILDSEAIAEKVLEKAGNKSRNFAVKAAKMLEVNRKNVSVVFARHVREIHKITRNPLGELPDKETKRRALGAIMGLSILAGDAGISFLEVNADDTDPEVRNATLDAISRIPSKRAVRFLVSYLYNHKNWEKNLEIFLSRMDKETATPMLVKFFYLRRDKWPEIIRVVGRLGGDQARRFILDTLDTWTFYTTSLPSGRSEEFIMAMLDAIDRFPPEEELMRALKLFKSEWKEENLMKSIVSLFKKDSDVISQRIDKILSEWRKELQGETV